MKERRKGTPRAERVKKSKSTQGSGHIPLPKDHRLSYLNGNGTVLPGHEERSFIERIQSIYLK